MTFLTYLVFVLYVVALFWCLIQARFKKALIVMGLYALFNVLLVVVAVIIRFFSKGN